MGEEQPLEDTPKTFVPAQVLSPGKYIFACEPQHEAFAFPRDPTPLTINSGKWGNLLKRRRQGSGKSQKEIGLRGESSCCTVARVLRGTLSIEDRERLRSTRLLQRT